MKISTKKSPANSRPFARLTHFLATPHELDRLDLGVSDTALRVLRILLGWASRSDLRRGGDVRLMYDISLSRLVASTHRARTTLIRAKRSLEEVGFVSSTSIDGHEYRFVIHVSAIEAAIQGAIESLGVDEMSALTPSDSLGVGDSDSLGGVYRIARGTPSESLDQEELKKNIEEQREELLRSRNKVSSLKPVSLEALPTKLKAHQPVRCAQQDSPIEPVDRSAIASVFAHDSGAVVLLDSYGFVLGTESVPNRYRGKCVGCGTPVPAGLGLLEGGEVQCIHGTGLRLDGEKIVFGAPKRRAAKRNDFDS